MKLVDILARELKVWPDALGHAVGQSADGTLHCEMEPAGTEIVWTSEKYTVCKKYISDCVTRVEWQAAVDALNADKCEHSYANNIGCPECGELNAPKVVEWDGNGSPEPGSSIEYSIGDGWYPCEVRYVLSRDDCSGIALIAWCEHLGKDKYLSNDRDHYFRPVRTAEQVAAEEREAEDNEVMSRYMSLSDCEKGILGHSPERAIIGLMRVMGYRKEPKPCGS